MPQSEFVDHPRSCEEKAQNIDSRNAIWQKQPTLSSFTRWLLNQEPHHKTKTQLYKNQAMNMEVLIWAVI